MASKDRVVIQGEEKLIRTIDGLIEGIRAKGVLGEIGAYLVHSITRRTQEDHKDVSGKLFLPYVPEYSFFRELTGYGTKVDLTVTGGMFAALTHEIFTDRVKVFFGPGFSRGSDVQHAAKAFYLQDKREFFGITAEDVSEVMRLYQINIEGAFRGQ